MSSPTVFDATDPVTWRRIAVRGADARSFLHGQLSCDVLSLAHGAEVDGLLLSPGGEVITSLTCLGDSEGIDLVVRDEDVERTVVSLRRFLLRTRCTLEPVTDGPEVRGEYSTVAEQIELGLPGPREFEMGMAAHSFGGAFVARRVSFTKGCFTGQELVGRLDARGAKVPFRLARVTGDDVAQLAYVVGSKGPQGDRALQRLTSVVGGEKVSALAVVHRTLFGESHDLVLDGVHVEILHEPDHAAG